MELPQIADPYQEPPTRKITALEFLSYLKVPNTIPRLPRLEVEELVSIVSDDFEVNGLILEDCIFHQGIIFSKVDVKVGVLFINCEFRNLLRFTGCKASKTEILDKSAIRHSFNLRGCVIGRLIIHAETDLYRGLYISEKCIIDSLDIKNVHTTQEYCGISISDSTVENVCQIQETVLTGQIRTEGSKFYGLALIEKVKVSRFQATLSEFLSLSINESKIDSVYIGYTKIHENCFLENVNVSDELELIDTQVEQMATICLKPEDTFDVPESWRLRRFYLRDCSFGQDLSVYRTGGICIIGGVDVDLTPKMTGMVRFTNAMIDSLQLDGFNRELSLVFELCMFNNVWMERLQNFGLVGFYNCSGNETSDKETVFETINSNLGKTEFRNFSFNGFQKVRIVNSQWTEIAYSSVNWFHGGQLETPAAEYLGYNPKTRLSDNQRRREIYRQLKHVCEKNGDRIQALEFKAREMRAHEQEVFGGSRFRLPSWFYSVNRKLAHLSHKTGDQIILWLGRTNDHGLNWIKPLGLTLFATALFYPFILVDASLNTYWSFEPTKDGIGHLWNLITDNWAIYWQMLNPARRTDIMLTGLLGKEGNISALVYFLETFHRIVLAFLIFQTITAFRKFVK